MQCLAEASLGELLVSPDSALCCGSDIKASNRKPVETKRAGGTNGHRVSGIHSKRNRTIGLGEREQIDLVVTESVIRWSSCTQLPTSLRSSLVCWKHKWLVDRLLKECLMQCPQVVAYSDTRGSFACLTCICYLVFELWLLSPFDVNFRLDLAAILWWCYAFTLEVLCFFSFWFSFSVLFCFYLGMLPWVWEKWVFAMIVKEVVLIDIVLQLPIL